MRRIERLINLIAALLETRLPMTAEQIRERIAGYDQESLDAFRRTFERDKEALRAMGIPLEVVRGDPLGPVETDAYVIPKARYYLPQVDLEPDELAALRIAGEAILGAPEAAEAGLLKLSIDEPTGPSPGPRVVWGTDVAAEQPLLGPLYAALLDRTPVTFGYRAADAAEAARRTVEPYGLVHRRGSWYLVGRDKDRRAVRSFRLSRMSPPLTKGHGTYDVPESFDAAGYVGVEAWEVGSEATEVAIVRFEATMRWWADQNMADHPLREAPEGAVDVELPVANQDALVSWVLGFGDGVEIVAPASARRRLREHIAPYVDGTGNRAERR
jgi:proteasome accessory factor B